MRRYIVVMHFHYDSTEPWDAGLGYQLTGEDNEPIPSFGTREAAEAAAAPFKTNGCTPLVWAVSV